MFPRRRQQIEGFASFKNVPVRRIVRTNRVKRPIPDHWCADSEQERSLAAEHGKKSVDPQLIDRIYESSFVPEHWPGVLDELGRIAEAPGGSLFITKAEVQYWTASAEIRERAGRMVNEGWFWRGQIVARAFAKRHAGFLTDLDILTPDELDLEPVYRDFWRPQGVGWAVGTAIPIPTGENVVLVMTRRLSRGPVERTIVQKLDELRPHLARSALVSARLQLERARAASEALALVGLPALVLNEQGKVLAANHLIEALTGYIYWRTQNRVALKEVGADKLLREAIAAIDLEGGASVRSFPVRDVANDAMMVAHLLPIRRTARDIFIRSAAVLVMTPVTLPQAPPVELVQSLFDLTPAEARVARSLAAGETVEGIAAAGGVARSTVSWQLRRVFEKTACNRQAEVVALLTGISLPRG
jgi:DNA-binding CsgD family transcriptional regulator